DLTNYDLRFNESGRLFPFVLQRVLRLIDNRFKCDVVRDGKIGKNLSIKGDLGGFEPFGETAVSHAVGARGGIETLNPKITKCAFARFAIAIGPILGLHDRVFRVAKQFRPAPSITFRFFYYPFASRPARRGITNSWHCYLAPTRSRLLVQRAVVPLSTFATSLADL